MNFKPVSGVLIEAMEKENKSGLQLVETADTSSTLKGVVVASGQNEIKEGVVVLCYRYLAESLEIDGQKCYLVPKEGLIGIYEQ